MEKYKTKFYEIIKNELKIFKEENFSVSEFKSELIVEGYPNDILLRITYKSEEEFEEEDIYKYSTIFELWLRARPWQNKVLFSMSSIQLPDENLGILFGLSIVEIPIYYDLIYN